MAAGWGVSESTPHARARAALAAGTELDWFTADLLPYIIASFEGWKVVYGEDYPGLSENNMRRVCELLTTEGILEKQLKVRGWHKVSRYRPARPEATPDGPAPAPGLWDLPEERDEVQP